MGMNPDTNRFEALTPEDADAVFDRKREELKDHLSAIASPERLLRPDGTPVPDHWSTFKVGEHVVIKGYTFRVAYIGETSILFEPVGRVLVGHGG